MNASTHTGAGAGKLYVMPADMEDIKAAIESGATIGEVNFKGESSAFEYDKKQELANVTF